MNHDHNHSTVDHSSLLNDFKPLMSMIGVVLVMTIITQYVSGNPWTLHFLMRYFMASFFLIFGAFKIINVRGFADAYSMYDLVAMRIPWYGYVYPFIEFGLGVAYLAGWYLNVLNWFVMVLMLVSAAGVLRALITGERLMCACLGTVFKIPMTYVTLAEDLVMAGMAAVMLLR